MRYDEAVTRQERVVSEARGLVERGASIEEVLSHLRSSGLRQIESVGVLRKIYGMSLDEADETIVFSETWADERDATLKLRDAFWAEAAEWADEVESNPDGRITLTFDLQGYPDASGGRRRPSRRGRGPFWSRIWPGAGRGRSA